MKRGLTLLLVFAFVFTISGNANNTNQPKTNKDLSNSAVSQTYQVTNTSDSGAGSLRQAIADANANPGLDIIEFAIASGAQTLTVSSQIIITDEVIIDGATQPGFASTPIITLNGSNVFRIESGATTTEIRNLAFQANGTFSGVAMYLYASDLKIEQNTFDDYSISLNGVARASLFRGNTFRDNRNAMRWDGNSNNDSTIDNNDFSSSERQAIWYNGRFNNNNTITNNNFTNSGGVSYWALQYSGVPAEINGNNFTGAGGAMTLNESTGFNLTAPGSAGPNLNTYGGHTFGVFRYDNSQNITIENWNFPSLFVNPAGKIALGGANIRTSTIRNNDFSGGFTHGIRFDSNGNNDNTLDNNNFSGSTSTGLWFNGRFNNNNTITNNDFTNSGGVSAWALRYTGVPAEINGNNFTGAGGAMSLNESTGFNLTAPGSAGPNLNTYGGHTFAVFRYDNSANITIENWNFSSLFINPAGKIALGGANIRTSTVQNNDFSGGFTHGIRFDSNGNNDNTLDNNNFSGSTSTGLWFNGRFNNNNTITNNDFRNSGGVSAWALRYTGVPAEINANDFTGAGGAMSLNESTGFNLTAPGSTGPNLNTYGGHTFGVFRYDNSSDLIIENWNFSSLFINPAGRIALGGANIRTSTIQNNDFSGGFTHGIRFDSNSNNDNTLDNNNFSGSTSTGLWFNGRFNNNNTITNNDFRNSGGTNSWALRYTGVPAEINANDFTGTGGAMSLNEATGFSLTAAGGTGPNLNTYGGHTFGVFRYDNSANITIENWNFAPLFINPAGRIALGGANIRTSTIQNNDFSGGFTHGIRFDSNSNNDNTLDNNNFSGSTSTGLWFNGRFNVGNTITNNDFRNSGGTNSWALRYTGVPAEINANDFTGTGGAMSLNESTGFNLTAPGSTGPNLNTYGGHTFGVFRYDNSANITIENWNFAPLFNDPTNRIALNMSNFRTSTIQNNDFSGGFSNGLRLDGNSNNDNVIDSNNFTGTTSEGLRFTGRFNNQNKITNNDFTDATGYGLYYIGIPTDISGNTFSGNGSGIFFSEANNFTLGVNNFESINGTGIYISNSTGTRFENLRFIGDGGTGIFVQDSRDLVFDNVEMCGKQFGIRLSATNVGRTNNVQITNSKIANSTSDAIRVEFFTSNSIIDGTQYFGNNQDLTDLSTTTTVTNSSTAPAATWCPATGPDVPFVTDFELELDENGQATLNADELYDGDAANSGITFTVSPSDFSCDDLGEQDVTLTGTDANGSTSVTVTVNIADNLGPQLTLTGGDQTVDLGDSFTDPGFLVTDNCSDSANISVTSTNDIDINTIGDYTVTYTAEDENGNSTIATRTVTVEGDTTAPVVVINPTFNVTLDANGVATITANDIDNGSSDETSAVSLAVSPSVFDCSNIGDNLVTLTVTDDSGNTATATSIVTVADNINPTITLLGDAEVTHDAFTPYTDAGVSFTDNCSSSATLDTDNPVDVNSPGEYTITYTVTDAAGNMVSTTRTVNVVDSVDPVAVSIPTLSVTLDENGQAVISGSSLDNGSSDNSGSVSLSVSPSILTCTDLGENTVTLTVADAQGNTATATTIVTVVDDETPTISLLGDPSVNHEAFTAYVDAGVSFDDNCTASTTLSTDNPVDVNTPGEYTITYTATDGAGNSVSTSRTVIIEDSTDPVASSIPSLTLNLNDQGQAVVSGSDVDNGSSDASGDISLTVSPASFDCSNLGVNTVTLTVTDASGNTSTSTTEVTIEDNTAPVISLIGDATITQEAFTPYNDQGVDVIENCSFNVDTTNPVDVNTLGTYTVTYEVTDASGNSAQVSRTVEVVDTTAPTINVQANVTVSLDDEGNGTLTVEEVDNGSSDPSGPITVSIDRTDFSCADVGQEISVVLTVTDINNNTDSITVPVTVEDNIAPEVFTRNITVDLENGSASITPEDVLLLSEDDINTGEQCEVTEARQIGMILTRYGGWWNNHRANEPVKMEDATDKEADAEFDMNGRHIFSFATFVFDTSNGSFKQNPDGTAQVTGILKNTKNKDDKWEVTLDLVEKRSWDEWSALGRRWRGYRHIVRNRYKNWDYYELASTSKMVGLGDNQGQVKNISHYPHNFKYGFQVGEAANNRDRDFGMSGRFYYKNRYGRWSIGYVNFDIANCGPQPLPAGVGLTADNCSIQDYSLDVSDFDCSMIGENTVNVTVTDASGNQTTAQAVVTVNGEQPTVEINDFTAVRGQRENTIFLGYGPRSVKLKTEVSGADDVTYEWTDSSGQVFSTKARPRVRPSSSETYTVTVTSASGCTATDTIDVCVIDVRPPANSQQRHDDDDGDDDDDDDYDDDDDDDDNDGNFGSSRVVICVTKKDGTQRTLHVKRHKVRRYLRRGATLGGCNATCIDASVARNLDDIVSVERSINIFPNPSQGQFKVELENFEGTTEIILYNFYGRVVQSQVENLEGKKFTVDMGRFNLKQGKYFLRIVSGKKSYSRTIIIQK